MATIKDVADLAGVSKSTASYAFNKPHLVKAGTLNRILAAAKELDYKPNIFAQGLAGGKAQVIGMLVPDIRYPFNATLSQSVEQYLRELGYLIVLASTNGETDETIKMMRQLHQRGVSGFILVPSYFGVNSKLVQTIKTMQIGKIPTVIGGFELDDPEIDQVSFQPKAGTRMLIDHLIDLGHRKIAFIGPYYTSKRLSGYLESISQHQILFREEFVVETDVTPDGVRQGLERLMSLEEPPTAIFSLNDVVALTIQDFCYTHKISIPEQLSVVSFDYQALVQRKTPGLTSVVVPMSDVGRASAELMLKRIQQPDHKVEHIEIEGELSIRSSTMPPPDL